MDDEMSKPSAVPAQKKDRFIFSEDNSHIRVGSPGLKIRNGEPSKRKRDVETVEQAVKSEQKFQDAAYDKENIFPPLPTEPSCSRSECFEKSLNRLKTKFVSIPKKNDERKKIDRVKSLWTTPYQDDIHNYLKEIEKKYLPTPTFMAKQTDINMNMRSIVIDWLVEVGEEYEMQSETIHLAVNYLDRFLSRMIVSRGRLQLIGTTSLLIASKFQEIDALEIKDCVELTNNAYTNKQFSTMEQLILMTLDCKLTVPTAYAFQQFYCSMLNPSVTVIHLSQYISELSLIHGDPFINFCPSLIAAGSIALANYTVGNNMWDENLSRSCRYKLDELKQVISCLHDAYTSIGGSTFQAICEKYQKDKFERVAHIQARRQLIFPDKSRKRLCNV